MTMNNEELGNFVIATKEELDMLFQNEIQREIFIKIIERLIFVIQERTSIHGMILHT